MMKSSFVFLFLMMFLSPGTASFVEARQWTRTEIIDYVNLSPLYVDLHDKAGWVGLFTDESFIQDPVGGHTFKKSKFNKHFQENQVELFWNAFIGKNNIKFEIKNDIVSDLTVLRDAVVDAFLPAVGAHVYTPAHLRYTLMEKDGQLRVKSLQAYWNMPSVTKDTLSRGAVGKKIMAVQLKATMDALGVGLGLGHFMKASLLGVNKRGQRVTQKMISAINAGNPKKLNREFHSDAKVIFNSDHSSRTAQEFLAQGYQFKSVNKMISAGNSVGFNFELVDAAGGVKTALGIAQFKNLKIQNLEIFTESHL